MTKQPNADEREELIAKARRFIDAGPIPGIATPKTPQWMADFALAVLRDREAEAVRAAFGKVKEHLRANEVYSEDALLDNAASGNLHPDTWNRAIIKSFEAMDAVLREYEGGEKDVVLK